MKKLRILLTISCIFLSLSAASNVHAEQIGLYAAPKFIWGFTTSKVEINADSTAGQSLAKFSHSFTKGTPGGALALGYDFSRLSPEATLRTEVELSFFKKTKVEKNWTQIKTKNHLALGALFLNIFYDIKNSTEFTPYIGAGVGASITKLNSDIEVNAALNQQGNVPLSKKTKKSFAWNIGAGVAYEFSEFFALDLGYRFASFGKSETKPYYLGTIITSATTKKIYMHQITLGARVTF